MTHDEALIVLAELLGPLPVGRFFDDHLGRAVAIVDGAADHPRAGLLGPDPVGTILAAWATHPSLFGFHADGVTGPPPPREGIDGPAAFAALIAEYQARGYTVHIPDLAPLSASLRRVLTAIELLTQQPAKASLFWSRPGNRAPVHFDNRDNLAIQLVGTKRWFVSTALPSLHNPWPGVAERPLPLGDHRVVDAAAGHLLFIPRGVSHTVETTSESLHLSITLLPVSVREAIAATLDHLSDYDRPLRETALGRADRLSDNVEAIRDQVVSGLERLLEHCRSSAFVGMALERRRSRFVGDLPKLSPSAHPEIWTPGTRLVHAEGAIAAMLVTPDLLDFAQPGHHLTIHRGAEAALRFITTTPRFALADIPGLDHDVRVALAERLLNTGFLAVEKASR